ncbi:NAD(P)H-dependent oxidoreductase subunit E [Deltaproteobacteria bacterium TL4]
MSKQTEGVSTAEIIPLLQEIQEKLGYIHPAAVDWLADKLKVSKQRIFGVATFYSQFRLNRPGKHQIKVCLGTACHVGGGENLLNILEQELGVKTGETTSDGEFGLERVACLGCCAVAPVMVVADDLYGKVSQTSIKRTLKKYKTSTETS